jgi:uncharacterized protein
MNLLAGDKLTLPVSRITDIGYMLGDEHEEVFMHKNEVEEELHEGQEVDVFLYHDHSGRLAATAYVPAIGINELDWVVVTDVKPDLGVFVDIGVSKDVLIGRSDLPAYEDVWPQVGDELYCRLKRTSAGRLIGKLASTDNMKEISTAATPSMHNKNVSGRIYRTLYVGSYILTDERFLGFIHDSERQEEPRLGQRVTGRIIDVKENGEINVSLRPRKQEGMDDDAQVIYEYMESRGGAMPFWDKSHPEDIKNRFNLSKAAFKRAMGKLLKEGKVYQEEGWTYFKKGE